MPNDEISAIGDLYVDLVADLHQGYGYYPAFKGFYLTQEWGWREGDFEGARADAISRGFLGPISNKVHELDPALEVGLSPSLDGAVTWMPCPAAGYSDEATYGQKCYFILCTFFLTRFLPLSLSYPARIVMCHLFWAMISTISC